MIEVMIACVIMSLFLGGVYQLFLGGSKTAGRAQWISNTVDQMRNALSILSREVRASTYPTTLFSDTFFDSCDNPDIAVPAKFYMRVLNVGKQIKPTSSGELKIMSWVVCEPEKPPTIPGKIIKNELYLDFRKTSSKQTLGSLRMKTEAFNFTTDKTAEYAKSGKLNLSAIAKESRTKILVNDVQYIEFLVAGNLPPEKPVDFSPISIKIHTLYPKDEKVFKENSIMATPQVAIDTL